MDRGSGANDHGPPREPGITGPEGGIVAQAYCVKDKQKVEIQNPQNITMKNGKPAVKGQCPMCGNTVFRIGAG
jgi:predicted RNA-binding Zn-ribbon protein involved in translation (DUF1610 family)